MVMFGWSANLFVKLHQPPADALEMYVIGKQWMWKMQHPEGQREINELHIPVGRAIKLLMTSQDVIHSFFVPAFRVKQDVLPGRYTTEWFQAIRPGTYHLFCAQYCGTSHSGMIGRVIAMEPEDFQKWLGGVTEETPAHTGERLFSDFNCVNCHATGARQRCPQLGGLYGTDVQLEGGGHV